MKSKTFTILLLVVFGLSSLMTYGQAGSASVTYSDGDLDTHLYFWSTSHTSPCPGTMTVSIPANALILSTDVSYDMTALPGSGIYRQRSQLRCVTTGGTNEPEVFRGPNVYTPGTHSYSRTGLDIANGITSGGDIEFELHAGATHYQQVCNANYGVVDNGTWTVTVHYIPPGYPMMSENPTPANEGLYVGLDDDLSWDFGDDTDTYDLYFGTDNPPTTLVVQNETAGTSGSYDPGTLATGETYYWQVVGKNSNGHTPGEVWSFITTCGTYATPFTQDFEDATAPELPYCWRGIVNSTSPNAVVKVETSAGNNGPQSLRMTNSNDMNATLIFVSPEIEVGDGSLADKMVNFFVGYRSDFPKLAIGTMSDPEDETTFTEYESFYVTAEYGEYHEYDIYFDEYTGTDKYIAFKLDVNTVYQGASLDDITIKDMPSCIRPKDLEAENLTINSATLSWTDLNGATSWNIEYGEAGFTPTGTPSVTGVTNPYVLTGLTDATDYEFYVQADCGDEDASAWSQMGSFTTPCDYFAVPFSEGFEGLGYGEMPGCWSAILLTADGFVQNGVQSGGHNSSKAFVMNNGGDVNSTLMLISPPVEDLHWKRIKFFAKSYNIGYKIIIGAMSDPANPATFDSLTSVTITEDFAYEEFDIWLNDYTGDDNYFAFKHSNEMSGLKIYIDEISIVQLPSCLPPVDLYVDNIQSTTADFHWTESGEANNWEIEVGELGFTPGTDTYVSSYTYNSNNTEDLSYELSGLTAATAYDVYVLTDCGDDDLSPWIGPISFLSGFDAFTGLPVIEDFETGFGVTGNNFQNVQDWDVNTTLQHSGTNSMHNAYGNDADNVLFMMGEFDFTTHENIVLSFWHIAKTDGRSDVCYVEISTDGGATYDQLPESSYLGSGRYREDDLYYGEGPAFDEDSYTDWGTGYQTPDNSWWKKEYFDLTDFNMYEEVVIRFRLSANSYTNKNGWYIDDIAIETAGLPDFYVNPVEINEQFDINNPIVNLDMIFGNAGGLPAGYTASVKFEEAELMNEDFNSGIPADWTIVHRGTTDVLWTDTASIYNRNMDGTRMAWYDGLQGYIPVEEILDEELISPAVDAAMYSYGMLQLEYDQVFDADWKPGDTARVYVFDGTEWVKIYERGSDDGSIYSGGVHKVWDVTEYANANFQVKFHYYEGSTNSRGRYYALDNVKLRGSLSQLDWLSLDNAVSVSGVALPDADGLTSKADVKLDGSGLEEDTYTAEIIVVSSDTSNSRIVVPVTYWSELSGADPFGYPNVICDGDETQLYANLTGGTGNQTYSWTSVPEGFYSHDANPMVNPTATTTYYVEVIDGEKTASGEVTITVNPLPEVNMDSIAPVCEDVAQLELTAGWPEGGVYSGPGVFDGVFYPMEAGGAGTYTISYTRVNQFGCDKTVSIPLTVVALPEVSIATVDSVCVGDEPFELMIGSPEGGVYSGEGVFEGMFHPSIVGEGTYVITYTYENEFGCENSAETTITVNRVPEVTMETIGDVCIDDYPIELTGGMPEGGEYFGPGVTDGIFYPEQAGAGTHYLVYSYMDKVGCAAVDSVEVNVFELPEVSMTDDMACVQWETVELTGGLPEGGEYFGPGVAGGVFYPQIAGEGTHTIIYTYTDENGCENSAEGTMTVEVCTGIGDISGDLDVSLAPNPNTGLFKVSVSGTADETLNIMIFNFTGQVVYEQESVAVQNQHTINVDLADQPDGLYFVQIITKSQKFTEKVIIQ